MEITVVSAEEWSGLYVDGKLEYEGHGMPWWVITNVLRGHGVSIEVIEPPGSVDRAWLENRGDLPDKLVDVIFE
jgi:hypothetical protein